MSTDHTYMQRALALAKTAEQQDEVPVGAVVVLNDQVVGEGYNQPISSCDPTAHAEIIAMRQAAKTIGNYRLKDAVLYVTLEPCAMCVGAIIHARVKQLVFAAPDPKAGAVCSAINLIDQSYFNHYALWQGDVCAVEAAELLRGFFQKRR